MPPSFINSFFKRARTFGFIRWLRVSLLKRLTCRISLIELLAHGNVKPPDFGYP